MLYKKKDDDSLVILKEINMHDLKASERQMALNEVSVTLIQMQNKGLSLCTKKCHTFLTLRVMTLISYIIFLSFFC